MPPWVMTALRLTGLGWFVAICIVLGILGGLWLGNVTGQVALLVLVGTVLGSVVAFYGVYRMILPAVYGSNNPNRSAARSKKPCSNRGGNEPS